MNVLIGASPATTARTKTLEPKKKAMNATSATADHMHTIICQLQYRSLFACCIQMRIRFWISNLRTQIAAFFHCIHSAFISIRFIAFRKVQKISAACVFSIYFHLFALKWVRKCASACALRNTHKPISKHRRKP